MSMLQIIQAPNTILATPAKKVTKIDNSIHTLIQEMTETLISAKDPEGVGLAAPQVGKSLQLFIIKESKDAPRLVFINPKLSIPPGEKLPMHDQEGEKTKAQIGKKISEQGQVKLEGCLSVQDIWGIVHRYPKVKVSYLDEHGQVHTKLFHGFLATIIQHEYDHLQGILFPRRVLEQKGKLYKSTINKEGKVEFEEMAL